MQRKVKVLYNPIAGRGAAKDAVPKVQGRLEAAGFAVECEETGPYGGAQLLVCDDSYAAVVVIGGDGALNGVVNRLESPTPVGLVPVGTANVLARELAIPLDPEGACAVIAKGTRKRLDLIEANGRRFVVMAGVGLDAEIVEALVSRRRGPICMASYAVPALQVISRYALPTLSVTVDGRLVTCNAAFVLVANGRGYGGPIEIASRARPDDGQLDVCIFDARNVLDMLKHFCRAVAGTVADCRDVECIRGTAATVTATTPTPYQVDGELAGRTPVDFRLVPGALEMIVP